MPNLWIKTEMMKGCFLFWTDYWWCVRCTVYESGHCQSYDVLVICENVTYDIFSISSQAPRSLVRIELQREPRRAPTPYVTNISEDGGAIQNVAEEIRCQILHHSSSPNPTIAVFKKNHQLQHLGITVLENKYYVKLSHPTLTTSCCAFCRLILSPLCYHRRGVPTCQLFHLD
jgi:hypothetical protein